MLGICVIFTSGNCVLKLRKLGQNYVKKLRYINVRQLLSKTIQMESKITN